MARHIHLTLPTGYSIDTLSLDLGSGEKWITLHPNGPKEKGVPVLVTGSKGHYKILGGAGGKFTGKTVGEITKQGKAEAAKAQEHENKHKQLSEAYRRIHPTHPPASGERFAKYMLSQPEGEERAKRYIEGVEKERSQKQAEPKPEAKAKETDLTKIIAVPGDPVDPTTASEWLRIIGRFEHALKSVSNPTAKEGMENRLANIREHLEKAGYDVPAASAQIKKEDEDRRQAEFEKRVEGRRQEMAEEDKRAAERLPKTASGEVDHAKLGEALGMSSSEIQEKLSKLGGASQLVILHNAALARQKQAAEVLAAKEHLRAVSPEKNTAIIAVAKPITNLGVRLRSSASMGVKDYAPPSAELHPHTTIAVEGAAAALKDTPLFNKNLSFLTTNMVGKRNNALMSATTRKDIGPVISMNTSSDTMDRLKLDYDQGHSNDWTQATKYADRSGSAEDFVKSYYHISTWHELGHIIDQNEGAGYGISAQITAILKKKFKTKAKIQEWVTENIGRYAATTYSPTWGWTEVTPELYAMKRLGKPVPDLLKDVKFDEQSASARATNTFNNTLDTADAEIVTEGHDEDPALPPELEIKFLLQQKSLKAKE